MITKLILEVGYNHNGSVDIAKQLIDEAAKLKVWAIKFQKWDVDGFPDEVKNKPRLDVNAFGRTQYDHRKFLEFDINTLIMLKEYAESKGLVFIVSGKDFVSLKQLIDSGIKYIKLPSQRFCDKKIYKYLLRQKDIVILTSTGMCTANEILKSKWLKKADVIMHCISDYTGINKSECQLAFYRKHKDIFNGYSSHEKNGEAIKYAVAFGARYIERHFTLDNSMKGTDHKISSTPKEVEDIINNINEIEYLLLSDSRYFSFEENKNRSFYRGF